MEHDQVFVDILEKHDLSDLEIPVPLTARKSIHTKWSKSDEKYAFAAWESGKTLNSIAIKLNRNPDDIILKIMKECKNRGIKYTSVGRTEPSSNWRSEYDECARELFSVGLPAWRIAMLFGVDQNFCKNKLYHQRDRYGHSKMSEFQAASDHKRELNKIVLEQIALESPRLIDMIFSRH